MSTPAPTPTQRPRRPWALAWMVVALVAVELAVRGLFTPLHVDERTYYKYYPAYNYGFDEDERVCWPQGEERVCQPTPYVDVHRQTMPLVKGEDRRLVVTIGSSVSRGNSLKQSYSNVLERRLARAKLPAEVQVLNLSASSIGSSRQRLRLAEALGYAPDLLLIHLHGDNESKDERDRIYSTDLHSGPVGLVLRSRAVVFLKKLYAEKLKVEIPTHGVREATNERDVSREAWKRQLEVMEDNLGEMLRLAEAAGVPVVLLGSTMRTRGFVSKYDRNVNDMIHRHLGGSVQFFDTAAVLREGSGDKPDVVFKDRFHYTNKGHEVIADALVPVVRQTLGL